MKKLQRHWQFILIVSAVFAGGGAFWWRSAAEGMVMFQGPPAYTALSEVERDAVLTLLAKMDLHRDVLVALNPSAGQAVSLLSTVRTWRKNNASTLAVLKTTIDRKVTAVRRIEKAIRMGPAQPGRDQELTIARQDLKEARLAFSAAMVPLQSRVGNLLSTSQAATWAAIKKGLGRRMPIQMLDLTDQQRLAVSKAQRTFKRQRAAASTAEQRNGVKTTRETALDQILTTDQETVMAAYYSNYNSASAAVADAFDTVLTLSEG